MSSVRLATCRDLPDGDEDGDQLGEALRAHGVRAVWSVWDDPGVDWSDAFTVVRSTWDYTARRTQFLSWVRTVPRIANPAAVMAWNSDKTYLRDLAHGGVPVVETQWFGPGEQPVFPAAAQFVVKPSVGAGSRGAGRFDPDDGPAAMQHAAALQHAGRVILVQPYLDRVDTAGETALIYIQSEFSHAIRKGAMLAAGARHSLDDAVSRSLYVEEHISARVPTAAELAVGDRVMDFLAHVVDEPLLYARVDLLPAEGGPVVVEVELTEPSLFLGQQEGAAHRFAAAIAQRV